jgi:SPX domain protein involved in polyphosphate accumulation
MWKERFVRKKKKRSPEELRKAVEERLTKLEKQNGEDAWEGFDEDEVTGLIDCALERVKATADEAGQRLSDAATELHKQAKELTKIGSEPPPKKPA